MNCVNHPDAAVAAYCQNCGKALCAACVRSVSGVIYCEQCLAAKLGIGAAPGSYGAYGTPAGVNYTANQGGYTVSGSSAGDMNFAAGGVIPPPNVGPNPGTATILGIIPGVGAMYNGQYVKALVHVLVFVILIGITDNHGIFGIFIAAWVVYQVFDAHQTAKARRRETGHATEEQRRCKDAAAASERIARHGGSELGGQQQRGEPPRELAGERIRKVTVTE